MANLSFEEAVEEFRRRIFEGSDLPDNVEVIDTIIYLWDQHRVNQMNKASVPSYIYDQIVDGELFIMISVVPLRYARIRRDKTVRVVNA